MLAVGVNIDPALPRFMATDFDVSRHRISLNPKGPPGASHQIAQQVLFRCLINTWPAASESVVEVSPVDNPALANLHLVATLDDVFIVHFDHLAGR